MKRIYFILIILFSFGQAEAQDKVDFLRTKVDGNRNIVDARLRLSYSLNIPRGASWSLNGAKDSIGYVMFNTTLQRFGVYHGSGVWKAYATIDEIDLLLDGKVDTIHGKGLSTEDYTTAEKSKLAGIAAGAEVNVNADWLAVSGDAQILNKPTFVATESDPVFLAQKGVANGVASLNSSGKIPNAQIPALALVDTYVTASQAAMLALSTAEQGDVAIRTDVSKTYILTDNNYSTLASWSELLSPIIPAETDPIWGASPSAGITSTNINNWNSAYGWGNHALAGYALASALNSYLPLTAGSGKALTGTLYGTSATLSANIAADWNSKIINTNSTDGYGLYIQGANNASTYLLGLHNGTSYKFTVSGDGLLAGTSAIFNGDLYASNVKIGTGTLDSKLNVFTSGVYGLRIGYLSTTDNYIDGANTYFRSETGTERLAISASGVKITTLTGATTDMVTISTDGTLGRTAIPSGGGGGTVVSVGVASANGFAGTSSGGANPAITLSTTISGLLKGNATAISAATAGTDYLTPTGSGAGLTNVVNSISGTTNHVIASASTGAITLSLPQNIGLTNTVQFGSLGVGIAPSYPFEVNKESIINYVAYIRNTSTTAGLSHGVFIQAGTNSSDNALNVNNASNTTTLFSVDGSGNGVINGSLSFGSSSYRASGTIRREGNNLIVSAGTTGFLINRHDNSVTDLFINSSGAVSVNSISSTGAISASNFSGSSSGTNTGDQINITGNAATATNVAWTGVTSRPTALSQFTNDLGNYGGWITGINSGMVTTALGYTPSNSTYTFSGIGTPTFSTITNVSTYTGYDNHYIRVGNEVTVRGKFLLGPTSTGLTVVRISFPTSPDPTRGSDSANGSASGIGIASGVINMHTGSNSAELSMNATTTFPNEVYYDFTYTAL